jgi:glutaredoxin
MKKKFIIPSLLTALFLTGCTIGGINQQQAEKITDDFIQIVLAPGAGAKIKNIEKQASGDFKVMVDLNGQEIASYLSADGKQFYPQALDIAELTAKMAESTDPKTTTPVEIVKKAKPEIELFVMSHCPFGTQMEKGILPVLDTLGDKVDFKLKWVNYTMHGEKELKEELTQQCVMKIAPNKFNDYLKCFLAEGNGAACLTEKGVDEAALNACVEETDKEFKVMENFADKGTWLNGRFPTFLINNEENKKYGIQGSPTLVINGQVSKSGRDAKSLLKNICDSFETAPEECSTELSAASPAPGFGWGEGEEGAPEAGCEA